MFRQIDETISRDRNLNFSLSDANSMQILDNHKKKETSGNVRVVKFSSHSSSLQTKEKETRKKEYDNYINTFTSSSNKNEFRQPGTFRPAKLSGLASGESSVTAITKSMKKASSVESPGARKLLRTPTQEMRKLDIHSYEMQSQFSTKVHL